MIIIMNARMELNTLASYRAWSVGILLVGAMAVCVTIVPADVGASPTSRPTCSNLEYYDEEDMRCHLCLSCPPGQGLSEVCGNGEGKNAQCEPCSPGTFSPVFSSNKCAPCRICSNTMKDAISCTAKTDRQCGPCKVGYFHYDGNPDLCQSCEDERFSHIYADCLRTNTPPAYSEEETSNTGYTVTTQTPEPSGDPSLGSVTIAIIVISVLVFVACLVIVAVLILKFCPPKCWGKRTGHRPLSSDRGPQTLPSQTENGTSSVEMQNNIVPANEEEEAGPRVENSQETSRLLHTGHDANRQRDSLQGAVPLSDRSNHHQPVDERPSCDMASDHSPDSENAYEDPNDHDTDSDRDQASEERRASDKSSSESRGTQTSSNNNVSELSDGSSPEQVNKESDAQRRKFLERLKKAIDLTSDTPLGDMHTDDINLLSDKLYVKPQLVETSSEFNYNSLAKLYSINPDDMKKFETAKDVVMYIANTDPSHPTVAKFLQKIADSNKCYVVVRKLVDQILQRDCSHKV